MNRYFSLLFFFLFACSPNGDDEFEVYELYTPIVMTMDEVRAADEVWITSSTKEIGAVVSVDGVPVGDGQIGDIWLAAQTLFTQHKYDY